MGETYFDMFRDAVEPIGTAVDAVEIGQDIPKAADAAASWLGGEDAASGSEGAAAAGGGFEQVMAAASLPFSLINMFGGGREIEKGEYTQGVLDETSGLVGAAGSVGALVGDEALAALGPAGAAIGLVASGNKFAQQQGWFGQDAFTGKNRTGMEMLADDVDSAYKGAGGGVLGAIAGAGMGLFDGAEVLGKDLVGGIASIGSGIGHAISGLLSW